MYETRFTVEGTGQFPLDMLRYDRCFPAKGEDAISMANDHIRVPRRIQLDVRHPFKGDRMVTRERWASFGWTLVQIDYTHKVV